MYLTRRALPALLSLAVVAFGLVLARIRHHDAAVLSRTTDHPIGLVAGRVELVQADLPEGRAAVFEVCSAALLSSDALVGHTVFAVVDRARGTTDVSVPFDADAQRRVRRGRTFGCLVLARAARLATNVPAAVVALHDATPAPGVPFAGHIVARCPLGMLDFAVVLFPALLAFAAVFFVAHRRAANGADAVTGAEVAESDRAASTATSPSTRLLLAGVALVAGIVGATYLPIAGAAGGLARGLLLIAAQLAVVAYVVLREPPEHAREAIAARLPARPALAFTAAFALGVALRAVSTFLLRWRPSHGTAAVERLVSPSSGVDVPQTLLDPFSGLLAFASVAIVAPIVEELFFRGVVYGAIERAKGPNAAGLATAVLFVLPHALQTGGAPAALVSIALLSLVTTYARRVTGSVVVPIVVHFVHNALVTLLALVSNVG